MRDGLEKPVAFASRTLAKAERNYAHLEREGLSVVFGVTYFHKYLYGRSFTIVTDNDKNHWIKTSLLACADPLALTNQEYCWIYKGTYAKTEIIVKLSSCVLGYVTI